MSRRPVALTVVALSAALLSACGTGQHAKTYSEVGRQDGAHADLGGADSVHVRNLHVLPPGSGSTLDQGSTAYVTGGVVNDGPAADALIGAESDAAASAQLTLAGKPVDAIELPAQGIAPADWAVELSDLSSTFHAAEYLPVTLVFQHAGRITLQVPVYAGDNGLPSRSPEQDPYGEPEPTAE